MASTMLQERSTIKEASNTTERTLDTSRFFRLWGCLLYCFKLTVNFCGGSKVSRLLWW